MQNSKIKSQNDKSKFKNGQGPTKLLPFAFCLLDSRKSGFGLVEILVVSSMVSVAVIGFAQVAQLSLRLLDREKSVLEATYIAEEGMEGMRALRDAGWTSNIASLTNGTTYYISATSTWSVATAPQAFMNGKYARTIVLNAVSRDASDHIAASGTLDNGTRKVTATVSWFDRNATTSVSVSGYLTNFLQN